MHVTETGVLQSPGFPGNYPSNMLCKWTLVAELDCDVVKLTFTHILLEENYDRLTVCLQDECSEEDLIVVTGIHNIIATILRFNDIYLHLAFQVTTVYRIASLSLAEGS